MVRIQSSLHDKAPESEASSTNSSSKWALCLHFQPLIKRKQPKSTVQRWRGVLRSGVRSRTTRPPMIKTIE